MSKSTSQPQAVVFSRAVKFSLPGDARTATEKGGGVSVTIPGEATDLRDLLTRFVRTGLTADDVPNRNGVYLTSDDLSDTAFDAPDIEKAMRDDVHDREEVVSQYILDLRETLESGREQILAEKREKEEKARLTDPTAEGKRANTHDPTK